MESNETQNELPEFRSDEFFKSVVGLLIARVVAQRLLAEMIGNEREFLEGNQEWHREMSSVISTLIPLFAMKTICCSVSKLNEIIIENKENSLLANQ
jgi:hypothetical protein